jgi:hypothetical protein
MRCLPDDEDGLRRYHDASPLHQLPSRVPTLLVGGGGDKDVPLSLVEAYFDAATAAGYWTDDAQIADLRLRKYTGVWPGLAFLARQTPVPADPGRDPSRTQSPASGQIRCSGKRQAAGGAE